MNDKPTDPFSAIDANLQRLLEQVDRTAETVITGAFEAVMKPLEDLAKEIEEETDVRKSAPNAAPKQYTPVPSELQVRHNAIVRDLRKLLATKDSDGLTQAVKEYSADVKKMKTSQLSRLHAQAALYVGDLTTAQLSYGLVRKLERSEYAALGIIAYEARKPSEALGHLREALQPGMTAPSEDAILAYAHVQHELGLRAPANQRGVLEPILHKSVRANLWLGSLYFNANKPHLAKETFARAARIQFSSEEAQLGLLRARSALGEDVSREIGAFYHATRSRKTVAEVEQALKVEEIELPEFKREKSLYDIARV